MQKAIVIAFFLCSFKGLAAEVDTIIIGDGGPGLYRLGRSFIDTSTIRLSLTDPVTAESLYVPPYTFIDEANALLFSDPLAIGTKLRVRFSSLHAGFPRIYSLYEKRYAGMKDTVIMLRDSLLREPVNNQFAEDNLTMTGYKSINVSVGTQGSMNLEQALDVSLAGEIAPHTTLSGHLSDQGTNLEGTREVNDFDRIYVGLENPKYSCLVGDQYVQWPVIGGLINGQKKLKGISAGYNAGGFIPGTVKAFGAVSGGNFTIQNMRGKGGLQGPYYLTGNGEKSFIIPMRGTLAVFVNDKKLEEGENAGFTIDYELGTITFTPKTLIRQDDLIRAEYEYRMFDYQRTLVGGSITGARSDSTVQISGGIWHETDDKAKPLDISLTENDVLRMSSSGDNAPTLHSSATPVDPLQVARESALGPLYIKESGYWKFKAFNKDSAINNQGYYSVWFQERGKGKGDYIVDDSTKKLYPQLVGTIYKYAGHNLGTATDSTSIQLPQSITTGEIRTQIKPLPWLLSTIDVAGMAVDKNLFSPHDDNDNLGSASDVSLLIGTKDNTKRSVWLLARNFYVTPNYTREVMGMSAGQTKWDDTSSTIRKGLRHTWETNIGGTILPGLSTDVSYGQYRHDNELSTDKVEASANLAFLKRNSIGYTGSLFRHKVSNDNTRRDVFRFGTFLLKSDIGLDLRDEWRMYEKSGNRGEMGTGASINVGPLSLKESATYLVHKKGDGSIFSASDTGTSFSWDQSISRAIMPAWHLDATTRYLVVDIANYLQQSTILATVQSDVTPQNAGFSSHQEYSINIEKASTYTTVGVYAQPGRGDAVWSDALGQYVPKQNGDYYMQQKEIFDSSSNARVRKTKLLTNWSYSPVKKSLKGLFADLTWYGSLVSEEHVSLDASVPLGSWVPGYMSLFTNNGLSDTSPVQLADCSYRQSVDWNPDSLHGVHAKLFFEPGVKKKIHDYSETSINYGGAFDRTVDPWTISIEATMLSVWRQSLLSKNGDSSVITDRSAQLSQRYNIIHPLTVSTKEVVGWAGQTGVSASAGWYYRIVPGIEWIVSSNGSAEFSYTYSYVGTQTSTDPRIAQGFTSGITNTIDAAAHINFATHFNIDLSYHGEIGKNYYNSKGLHVLSMQVKAYL